MSAISLFLWLSHSPSLGSQTILCLSAPPALPSHSDGRGCPPLQSPALYPCPQCLGGLTLFFLLILVSLSQQFCLPQSFEFSFFRFSLSFQFLRLPLSFWTSALPARHSRLAFPFLLFLPFPIHSRFFPSDTILLSTPIIPMSRLRFSDFCPKFHKNCGMKFLAFTPFHLHRCLCGATCRWHWAARYKIPPSLEVGLIL